MKIKKYIDLSTPTAKQIKHDIWVTVVAFLAAALVVLESRPDKLSKDAWIAAGVAGIAAAITTLKSIVTKL